MVELYVAVSPDTGEEYVVSDRGELVNMLARGYVEKDPFERQPERSSAGEQQPQPRPVAQPAQVDTDLPVKDEPRK